MKAIILCAGLGTRLKPLTDVLPKPLIPVLGRPIVENIILSLKHCGVSKIAINTHHFTEKLVAYLRDGRGFGVKIHYSHEVEVLGTGGGIGNLREFLKDDLFIVHNGDVLTSLDFIPAIGAHVNTGATVTLLLYDFPPINTVTLASTGEIVGINDSIKKSTAGLKKLTFTGISVMDHRIMEFLPKGHRGSIIDVYVKLINLGNGSIRGYIINDPYLRHIGTISEYFKVHQEILVEKRRFLWNMPSTPKPFYIDEGSVIEEGVSLKGFVSVGRDCVIKKGAFLENCVIWDDVVIKGGERLRNAIRGQGVEVLC